MSTTIALERTHHAPNFHLHAAPRASSSRPLLHPHHPSPSAPAGSSLDGGRTEPLVSIEEDLRSLVPRSTRQLRLNHPLLKFYQNNSPPPVPHPLPLPQSGTGLSSSCSPSSCSPSRSRSRHRAKPLSPTPRATPWLGVSLSHISTSIARGRRQMDRAG